MSSKSAAPTLTGTPCFGPSLRVAFAAAGALALAGCATQSGPGGPGPGNGRYFDPILGVWASPRVVADGEPIPRGGGGYLVGRPYTVGGKSFVPIANPRGYTVTGTASWYGDAFHGRRTANGEIFDKGSISAAHPTLPLPSYVRVTNLKNGWSMVVRVNDRGPYHGGRVMDVSEQVAATLDFKQAGTGRIRVDYLGRAGLRGSDDAKLRASLRTDGTPAHLDGADESAEAAGPLGPLEPIVPLIPPPLRPPLERAALIARGREEPLPLPVEPPPLAPVPPFLPTQRLSPAHPLSALPPRRATARFPVGRDPFFRPLPAAVPALHEPPSISFGASTPASRSYRARRFARPARDAYGKPPPPLPEKAPGSAGPGEGQP